MTLQLLLTKSILFTIVNAQVIYISTPTSWTDAKLDCINRGSSLLTAQGNTADITECINAASTGSAWIGLNRLDQADWAWTANDITYDANAVNWASNAPGGRSQSDCAEIKTSGGRTSEITNRQIACTDLKQYCCNPVSTTPTPTAITSSPTDATSTPTASPTAPTTAIPTDSTAAPTTSPAAPTTAIPTAPTTANPTTVTPSPTDSTSTPTASPTAPTTAAQTDSTPTPVMTPSPTDTTSNPTVSPTAPTTASPTTAAPTTAIPTTANPTTAAPTTSDPTSNPVTDAPTTAEPTTLAPVTSSPTSNPTTASPTGGNCPRIRKEWNTATRAERDLYINGLLTLSAQGKLQKFTQQHAENAASNQAHSTSAFLTWHRLFLWELEEQFRSLGGQYECFALLYWNWGKDVADVGSRFSRYSVTKYGLGSTGDSTDNYCVKDGSFAYTNSNGYTPYYCGHQSTSGQCCLKRRTYGNGSPGMRDNAANEVAITSHNYYGSDSTGSSGGIRDNVEVPHGYAHCIMGTCGSSGGHLGNQAYSPDDPIFYLLHGFVDYLWALWQDYHDYDLIDKTQLTSTHYNGQKSNSGIDTELEFDMLKNQSWCTLNGTSYTSRDMHSISDWKYSYDAGSFINEYGFPSDKLNPAWFTGIGSRRRRRRTMESNGSYAFEKLAKDQLTARFGAASETYDGRRQMAQTLAQMSCQYLNPGDMECKRPKSYDDCSDMELVLNPNTNRYDINITLDELIGKVSDYPCMVTTRERMYSWTRDGGNLWRLCRGDFDTFCDREFIEQDNGNDICVEKGYIKDKDKGKRRRLQHDEDEDEEDGLSKYELEDLEGMVVNASIHGLVFIFILVNILLVYVCYNKLIRNRKENVSVEFVTDAFI